MRRFPFWIGLVVLASAWPSFAATPSLKQREDPFYIGASTQLSGSEFRSTGFSQIAATLQAEYGWSTGIATQLQIPSLFHKDPETNPNDSTPRIGGGPTGRMEIDGLYRAWGDTYDYVGFLVGLGLPFQTTQVQQVGSYATWLLTLQVLARADWDWISVQGILTDNSTFMHDYQAGNANFYYDTSNTVIAGVSIYTYPTPWLAPFVGFSETFPSAIKTSIRAGQGIYSIADSQIARSTSVYAGMDWAPAYVPVLLGATFNYFADTPLGNGTGYSAAGRIRWLF